MKYFELGKFEEGRARVMCVHLQTEHEPENAIYDGVFLDLEIPEPEVMPGYVPLLYINEELTELSFEYTDAPFMFFTREMLNGVFQAVNNVKTNVELFRDALGTGKELETLKKLRIDALKEECTAAIYNGFQSPSIRKGFGFNEHDQANFTQQTLIILGDKSKQIDTVQWKSLDGSIVNLTIEQFNTLIEEAATHKITIQNRYWRLEAFVKNASTEEELASITW